ncbi:MAG: RDD family protein, partial [Burkholderiaceae bacterium]
MKLSKNSGPTTDLTNFKTASVWVRFMAMVYETILLVGPIFFSILISSLLKAYVLNDNGEGALHPVFVQAIVLFLTAGYFTWSWSNNRVTLPMKTLTLRVVSRSGDPLT